MNSCFNCKHFQYEYLGYDEELNDIELMGCDKDQDSAGLNFNGECKFYEESEEEE